MLKDAFKMLSLMWKKKKSLELTFGPLKNGFHIWGFNQLQIENIQGKKNPEKSNKQNLSFLNALATVYTAFILYYQTKSRNDLQNTGGCT